MGGALIFVCILLVTFVRHSNGSENGEQESENAGLQIGKLENNNGLVNIENIQGNKIVIKDNDVDQPLKPLVFSEIDVNIPYGYFMDAVDRKSSVKYSVYAEPRSEIEGQPNPHSQDIVLGFDITNPNSFELRVVGLYIDVLEYRSVSVLATHPVSSAGKVKKFFCNIKSKNGSYPCTLLSNDYDFVKIARGELENFGINVNTVEPGVYKLGLAIEFSIGGKTEKVEIGKLDRLVGFF